MFISNRNQIFRLLLFVVIALFAAQTSFAVTKQGKKKSKTKTRKVYKSSRHQQHNNNAIVNPWSINISLVDEYDDNAFDGVRLSIQKMMNRNSAVKFSLGVLDKVDDPFNSSYFYNDGVLFEFDEYQNDTKEVNLSLQYMYYPNYNKTFNLYWGVGPRLSFTEAKFDPEVFIDVPSKMEWVDYADFNSSSRIGLGLEGSFGGELFLGSNFSFNAEYGFILENRWYVFDVDYYNDSGYHDNKVEVFNDGSHLDWSRFRVGFSLHF